MNWGTLALAIAFGAAPLACSSGAGNEGTDNTICGTCPAGLVCERYPPAACADPTWDQWPVPNSDVDVAAGAPNLQSYADNGDGTVTDNVTGLMWQQAVPATTHDSADAVAYCQTLTLAGHGDWRLPSMIELVSIVDYGHGGPSIDPTYFPSTPASSFWSSSPLAGASSYGYGCIVDFDHGYTYNVDVSYSFLVRCVR
jgi:hypothetical protein